MAKESMTISGSAKVHELEQKVAVADKRVSAINHCS
jgi:hypothetical protein